MATTFLVGVIGVVSGIVTITGFVQSNWPDKPAGEGSTVRCAVTLNGNGLSNADGKAPSIQAWNENRETIGLSDDGQKIKSGSFADIFVDHHATGIDATGQQPTFIQLAAFDDAICVAYLSQTWPDGTNRGWLGDMGKACVRDWFALNVIVGDEGHKPACTWMDTDLTKETNLGGMQIHMEDFINKTTDYSTDPNYYCNPPVMSFRKDFKEFDGIDARKRSVLESRNANQEARKVRNKRQAVFEEQLIESSSTGHSAQELCGSETSRGPDFVSLEEGLYCDMMNKQLSPLCSATIVEGCYDRDAHALVTSGKVVKRQYKEILKWD